jgi:hypothetical protein
MSEKKLNYISELMSGQMLEYISKNMSGQMPELMSALHIKFSIGESTCEKKSRLLCPNICQHMCQNVWHMKFASIYVRKCKMSEDMSEFKHTSEYMSK